MDVFSAVADPVRRDILALLVVRPTTAGKVATAFTDISRPAVSRHLRVLRQTGLVRAETQGRRRVYAATIAPLGQVTDWIDGLTPGIDDSLDALETEVYRTRRERTAREGTASESPDKSAQSTEERTA